jgi:hypothetical protein
VKEPVVKLLKVLGVAAVLVLMSGAVAFAAEQVMEQAGVTDDTVETDGQVRSENCVRVNEGDGEQVRTHTRTGWSDGGECDCEQPKVRERTQTRDSWLEYDGDASRTLTQTRYDGQPEGEAAVPSGPGNGKAD